MRGRKEERAGQGPSSLKKGDGIPLEGPDVAPYAARRTKIRLPPPPFFAAMRFCRLLALILLPALAGCSLFERPPLETVFGAPYDILVGVPAMGEVDRTTPFVNASGALVVVVEYRGGCSTHRFALDYVVEDDAARVWLVHHDPGDACTDLQQEERSFSLGPVLLQYPTLVLVSPSGGEMVLRVDGRPTE